MSNPWEDINLSDYESHMSLQSVYQLQSMNEIMREQFSAYNADTVMILGIAAGNGLEHIDKKKFKTVYGVDINQNYLDECNKRYSTLDSVFKPICADLSDKSLKLPCADMLVANLLIEYIGYECFQRVVKMSQPQYVSCIIQINTETAFVSDSPYLHVFDRLNEVHHQLDQFGLIACMNQIGYSKKFSYEKALPNGKKLMRIDFIQ